FLPAGQMREVMHGDRVAVRVTPGRGNKTQGHVVEILERGNSEVVGRYYRESGVGFVVPDNSRITQHVVIPKGKSARARHGQVVVARIDEPPTRHSQPVGSITELLGGDHTPGIETEIAIRAHDLPHEWPSAVESEAARVPEKVPPAAKRGRVDLRELPLVTIDGADARDFDDAVYAQETAKGWKLYVAIADVAQYVKPDSALDKEAVRRGTSVYFPTRVIPMLPEALSNGLCSLNPKVDRLCMVCEMLVDRAGKVTRSRFYEGLMRSAARLTYNQVAAALYENDRQQQKKIGALLPHLQTLDDLYRAFAAARRRRGAIEFESSEVRFRFNEQGRIVGVEPYVRNDVHKIIEECMIAANVQAAKFLKRHRLPTLYRRHDAPEQEKREMLIEFLQPLGLKLPVQGKIKPADYARVLREVSDRPDAEMIQTIMLRSMPQAVYAPSSEGHFGLALENYAHFTSPIRRYPDLLVHRGIKHWLRQKKLKGFGYSRQQMELLGQRCSAAERRADEATRDAIDWLKTEFMQDKIGEVFQATISGVTNFGVFVQLDDVHIEGLVHVSTLGHDYFQHDPARHRLVGENTGLVYQLSDRVRVRVVSANMEESQIDFELVQEKDSKRSKGDEKKSKKKPRSNKSRGGRRRKKKSR
ncbi:MAG: ribonuclease R, partial [Gammaproteobacteria bacterium]|nr:ribonuclease R [Gammaproteobacteria bacterium]